MIVLQIVKKNGQIRGIEVKGAALESGEYTVKLLGTAKSGGKKRVVETYEVVDPLHDYNVKDAVASKIDLTFGPTLGPQEAK